MNSISYNKHFLTSIIASIFLVYGIGVSNSPYAKVILIILAIFWLGLVFWSEKKDGFNLIKIFSSPSVIFFCIFLLFFLIGVLAGNNLVLGLKYFGTYALYLMIFLMYEYYSKLEEGIYLKFILKCCFWGFMLFAVIAMVFYTFHPGAARVLAREPDYYGIIIIGGGYQLAYLASILICYLMLNPDKKNILLCIALEILLIKTQSTITILISLIGAFASLLSVFLRRFSRRNKIIIVVLGLLIVMVLFMLRDKIGDMLVAVSGEGNTSITERVQEVGNLLKGENVNDQRMIAARVVVYKESLNVIKKSPIFGEMFSCGVIPGFGSSGGHSDILDAISQWGVIFGGIYLAIFISGIAKVKKMLNDGWSYVIVMILLLLLNPTIGFSLCVGAFFMVPAMQQSVINKKKGNCNGIFST